MYIRAVKLKKLSHCPVEMFAQRLRQAAIAFSVRRANHYFSL